MSPVYKVILKYSLLILILRFLTGLALELLPFDKTIVALALFIPNLFVYWFITHQGTLEIGRIIRKGRKIEYLGDLIITIPILLELIAAYFLSGQLQTGLVLLIVAGTLGAYRAAKQFN